MPCLVLVRYPTRWCICGTRQHRRHPSDGSTRARRRKVVNNRDDWPCNNASRYAFGGHLDAYSHVPLAMSISCFTRRERERSRGFISGNGLQEPLRKAPPHAGVHQLLSVCNWRFSCVARCKPVRIRLKLTY